MLKAIVFCSTSEKNVEENLGKFLEKNPNIKIISMAQTDVVSPTYGRKFTISLMYAKKLGETDFSQ